MRACPDEKFNLVNIRFYLVPLLEYYIKLEEGTREQVESLCLKLQAKEGKLRNVEQS